MKLRQLDAASVAELCRLFNVSVPARWASACAALEQPVRNPDGPDHAAAEFPGRTVDAGGAL